MGIQVTDRIVGDSGEMNDGVESDELGGCDVTYVAWWSVHFGNRSKIAALEPTGVESDHFVSMSTQEWHKNGPDVPAITGY
jgi:hypothetical protein